VRKAVSNKRAAGMSADDCVRLLRDPRQFTSLFLRIRTKSGEVVKFRWNAPQERLYEEILKQREAGKPVRVVILKARQMGFSTMAEGLIFHDTATRFNCDSLIIAHQDDATAKLFRMSKLFYDALPDVLKPMLKASNAQELLFENPTKRAAEKQGAPGLRSSIRCVTAGGRGVGRSFTFQNLHASEVAFWPGDVSQTWAGVMQAVPSTPGTMVIVESTANGFNWFKDFWDRACSGESDFVPVFFAWFENPEYRMVVPPGFEMTVEERELRERFGICDEQLCWRRWCIANNCAGDLNKFKQEYPSTPDEAFIHSGSPVFDNEVVITRREAVRDVKPLLRGGFDYEVVFSEALEFIELSGAKFVERADGFIRIYELPVPGRPYVIGGDTAGEGSDWFTAMVLDNTSGKLVAVLRQQFDEDLYARQVFCLGKFYNDALVAIESNFTTFPITMLQQMGYPRQYVRERVDTFTGQLSESFGFRTDLKTRPLIVAELVQVMRESPELVGDWDTLGEMLTFVKDERGRPGAMSGSFDDLVMGLAIAHFVRPQQSMLVRSSVEAGTREWSADMWADYDGASSEVRKILVSMWGQPPARR